MGHRRGDYGPQERGLRTTGEGTMDHRRGDYGPQERGLWRMCLTQGHIQYMGIVCTHFILTVHTVHVNELCVQYVLHTVHEKGLSVKYVQTVTHCTDSHTLHTLYSEYNRCE